MWNLLCLASAIDRGIEGLLSILVADLQFVGGGPIVVFEQVSGRFAEVLE